jgi:hypothetical protein
MAIVPIGKMTGGASVTTALDDNTPIDNGPETGDIAKTAIPKRNIVPIEHLVPAGDRRGVLVNKLKSIFPKTETEEGGTEPEDIAMSAVRGTGRDLVSIPAAFFNQYAAGFPKAAFRSAGYKYPAPTLGESEGQPGSTDVSPTAGVLSKAAGMTGMATSPINKVALGGFLSGKWAPTLAAGAATGAMTAGEDLQKTIDPMEVLKRATMGALTSGVVKGSGEVLGNVIPESLKAAGKSLINDSIKRLPKYAKYGADPARAVIEHDLTGSTPEESAFKAQNRMEELGQQKKAIFNAPENADKTVDGSDYFSHLDAALAEAKKAPKVNAALVKRLTDAKGDLQGIIGGQDLANLSPEAADTIKRETGKLTKFTGMPSDDQAYNMALKKTYGSLADKIHTVLPEVKDANANEADVLSVIHAVQNKDMFSGKEGQALNILKRGGLWTALSAVPAAVMGHPGAAMGLAGTGAAEEAAAALAGSPAVKTGAAKALYNTGEGMTGVKDALMAKLQDLYELGGSKAEAATAPELAQLSSPPKQLALPAPEPQGSVVNLPETPQTVMDAKVAELKKSMGVPEYGDGPRSMTPEGEIPKDVGATPEQEGLIMEKRRRAIIDMLLKRRGKNFSSSND